MDSEFCHWSEHGALARHEIPEGARRITISPLAVQWGKDDLRDEWQGTYTFCSFACLAGWAGEKAAVHDGATLKEGDG